MTIKHLRLRAAKDAPFVTACGVKYVDGSAPGSDGGATSWYSEVTCPKCRSHAPGHAPPPPNVRANRAPPKGGLDFAAMSAAWRKAGKPGDWRSWVKVHPIHKR